MLDFYVFIILYLSISLMCWFDENYVKELCINIFLFFNIILFIIILNIYKMNEVLVNKFKFII